jgi:hypothetical protein
LDEKWLHACWGGLAKQAVASAGISWGGLEPSEVLQGVEQKRGRKKTKSTALKRHVVFDVLS